MIELGQELIRLAKSDAGKREEVLKAIETKVVEIEKYKVRG